MEFEIKKEYPPNYEEIKNTLGFSDDDVNEMGIVFAYGIVLYNPTGFPIPPHLLVHEKVHQRQQLEMGVKEWWDKYLVDRDFRLSQEIEAYATQYSYVKPLVSSSTAKTFLSAISSEMASKVYGFMLEYGRAESLIRHKAKAI